MKNTNNDYGDWVSIIMPAYNAASTIRQAVQSVQVQTYTKWELIIVDDFSTDSTVEVVKEIIAETQVSYCCSVTSAKKNEKEEYHLRCQVYREGAIRLLKNTRNLGVAISRNRGIQEAKGAWIAFLDSDDMWHSDKLKKQLELASQKMDADIIYTGSSFLQANGYNRPWIMKVPETVTYRQLLKQNVISCSSVLIKRELVIKYPMIQRSGGYGEIHEDYPVWLLVLKNGGHAYGLDEPLLIYRVSGNSRSANKFKAALMTYHVYRYIGLGRFQTMYYFFWYVAKNLRKYYLLYS